MKQQNFWTKFAILPALLASLIIMLAASFPAAAQKTDQGAEAQTGTFGNYRFDDLPSGETYILTINSKHFVFAEPTTIVNLTDNLTDLNFSSKS
ncbi:MAG: hypothetical protein ABJA66_14055 [Actinomycetota bacterium]